MKRILTVVISIIFLASCASRINISNELSAVEKKYKDNTGFMLYDPTTHKTIHEYNAGNYFVPASNTKILTLYTALHILGDSIAALKYIVKNDSLIVWGTGDPSFLYKEVFNNSRIYNFLQGNPHKLFVGANNYKIENWGPGWAWDDYFYSYSAERSPFPLYGNIEIVKKHKDHFSFTPSLLQNHFVTGDSVIGEPRVIRDIDSNQITYFPGTKTAVDKTWEIPFHYSSDVLVELLSDTLKRQVDEINVLRPTNSRTIYSIPADSLYTIMMKFSDNFIAEQLLQLCAEKLSDTLNSDIAIRYAKKNLLSDLPDEFVWVDGSGLSHYNLTTPRNIVKLWDKLYHDIPKERLFKLLSIGGQKGTLKNYYNTNPPFIFGKTGSLSNQISLSGYLVTKKGRVLIFSFMNGNFIAPARDIRTMMENVLTRVRDKY